VLVDFDLLDALNDRIVEKHCEHAEAILATKEVGHRPAQESAHHLTQEGVLPTNDHNGAEGEEPAGQRRPHNSQSFEEDHHQEVDKQVI